MVSPFRYQIKFSISVVMDPFSIKRELQDLLQEDIGKAFDLLDKWILPQTDSFNKLVLLKSRWGDIVTQSTTGVYSQPEALNMKNGLRSHTLNFINLIPKTDFKSSIPAQNGKEQQTAHSAITAKVFELLDLVEDLEGKKVEVEKKLWQEKNKFVAEVSAKTSEIKSLKTHVRQLENRIKSFDNMLFDREVLRMGILIALADDDFHEKEASYLLNRADAMDDHVKHLSDSSKGKILRESILMAFADGEFKHREYLQIHDLAQTYGFSDEELKKEIIENCLKRNIDPPKALEKDFQKYKQDNNLK